MQNNCILDILLTGVAFLFLEHKALESSSEIDPYRRTHRLASENQLAEMCGNRRMAVEHGYLQSCVEW